MTGSLKDWVEKEPWKKDTWENFMKDELIPFYEVAYKIYAISKKFEELKNYASISDIPEEFRDRVKTAVYGGVKDGREIESDRSFARFMYDYFGVSIAGAGSFDESIKKYAKEGEHSAITIRDSAYIKKVGIKEIVSDGSNVIKTFFEVIYTKDLNEIFAEKKIKMHSHNPLLATPDRERSYEEKELFKKYFEILPDMGESSDNIVKLISEFEERAAKLSVGVSPHMSFAFYIRYIPLEILCQFLGDEKGSMERAKGVMNILGPDPYTVYDISTLEEKKMPSKRTPSIFLKYKDSSALGYLIKLHEKLHNMRTYSENFENFVRNALNSNSMPENIYEPWECFSPLFKKAIECSSLGCSYDVYYENGKMRDCAMPLKDFLIKLFPLMSSGGITKIETSSSWITLHFSEPAREFAERIIDSHGGL